MYLLLMLNLSWIPMLILYSLQNQELKVKTLQTEIAAKVAGFNAAKIKTHRKNMTESDFIDVKTSQRGSVSSRKSNNSNEYRV